MLVIQFFILQILISLILCASILPINLRNFFTNFGLVDDEVGDNTFHTNSCNRRENIGPSISDIWSKQYDALISSVCWSMYGFLMGIKRPVGGSPRYIEPARWNVCPANVSRNNSVNGLQI